MLDKLTKYNPLYSASLLLAGIFLLILVVMLASRSALPPQPQAAVVVSTITPLASPTLSETPTLTASSTPRPTFTLAPTLTPTQTGTPTQTATITPLPTLPSARPLRFNDLYFLKDWTPEQADYAVRLMQGVPDARFRNEADRQSQAYNQAFSYAAFAQQEALLRYPEAEQAEAWRWGLAYSLARLNDSTAADHYAALIAHALSQNLTNPSTLPAWFQTYETRMELTLLPLPELTAGTSRFLAEIKSAGGGVYLIISETVEGYVAEVVLSRFDFANQRTPQLSLDDLTGDEYPEAVIAFPPGQAEYTLSLPEVFDLTSSPPAALLVDPGLPFDFGGEYQSEWLIATDPEGRNVLQFIGTVFPACPVRVTRSYRWDGTQFTFEDTNYTINPIAELTAYCEGIINHAALVWEPEVTARFMKVLLPEWPPERNPDGRAYPRGTAERWRLRTAVFTAMAGEQEEALEILRPLLESADAADPWQRQAAEFAASYQQQSDIYKACLTTETCEPQAALRQVVRQIPVSQYNQIPAYLQQFGVVVRASGIYDFENDGEPERWLLVRHREGQKLELWMLARAADRIEALYVETVDTTDLALRYHEPVQEPPVVQTRPGVGFQLERVPGSREPFLVHQDAPVVLTRYTEEVFAEINHDFLSGADPAAIRNRLEILREASRFNCRQFCDQFYYMLALTYELTGQGRKAVDQYIDLWWNYSSSPYTHMARLKLDTLRTATPTQAPTSVRTPTPVRTPTQVRTPTAPGLQTPTVTPSPFDSPTPGGPETPYFTPTSLPYPYPP